MDEAGALRFLEEFRELLAASEARYQTTADYFALPEWKLIQVQIQKRLQGVRRITEQVQPDLLNQMLRNPGAYHWEWGQARDALLQVIGVLEQSERIEAILEPVGPTLAAARLHPWVWDAAAKLWDDGHYAQALQASASSVDGQLQAKLGRDDISGADLVTQAFTLTPPEPGKPRLRFPDLPEGSQAYKSDHEGAMSFGQGCMKGIRNPASHNRAKEDEQVALEQLAALSVLARWIDEAEVARSP
jgi:hypothetical protein